MEKLQQLVDEYINSTNVQLEVINSLIEDIVKDQKEIISNFNKLLGK